MMTCEAAGPTAIVCSFATTDSVTALPLSSFTAWPDASALGASKATGCTSSTVLDAENVCTTPCETSSTAPRIDSGSSTYSVERTRSVQKLPIDCADTRVKPRTKATSTARPVAAETKFCTASPSICVR